MFLYLWACSECGSIPRSAVTRRRQSYAGRAESPLEQPVGLRIFARSVSGVASWRRLIARVRAFFTEAQNHEERANMRYYKLNHPQSRPFVSPTGC